MTDLNANFCLPLPVLENDRVRLTPFVPSLHQQFFYEAAAAHPEVFHYLPYGPSKADLDHLLYGRIAPDPSLAIYAVLDKTNVSTGVDTTGKGGGYPFVGTIGWIGASAQHLKGEITFRKGIATQAASMMLRYALDLPSAGGLGLRRVQWQAYVENSKSVRLSQSLGLVKEGVLRWDRVHHETDELVNGTSAYRPRAGDPREGQPGRNMMVLAICWDDWEKERGRIVALVGSASPR
ncbi:hypothetical protein CONPUDRAFT_92497 [Coniophora puteana RWD-64-598 SS2]|uniref:N-acetyltransferase domain-containing protein n=1 Tax=Coniophora puteana (strain RWD-64-598) TaxID=741705 RepID=A0A5M3MDL1_CONPW|nr:uncharacterized protein CONPUDRAFT_92497 [Coniophora puteana RWD-64-598 SS2]EIW77352.1 hypothetical protein CONPUDRAFT_92497 [Coniophora puteana RWD-64-598 SS2]